MNVNFQKELEKTIAKHQEKGEVPSLLLHSCCAPCSSYVIEYLSSYFEIAVFYYNPNIYPDEEYEKRAEEQMHFIREFPAKYPLRYIRGDFEKNRFYERVKGYESIPEGGERCFLCYELRLEETAKKAREVNADYFTTTLSISPLKNAAKLNEIGQRIGHAYQIPYLLSDFKKKNGYKRSVELSNAYGMYRQDYCGCVFSKQEREAQKKERN